MHKMVSILTPLSIWIQLSNFFFLLCGLNGDLLLIRLTLLAAYGMIVVHCLMGSPLWTDGTKDKTHQLSLDNLLWAVVSLYVHASSLLALCADEAPVRLHPDKAALWRMMYRFTGLSPRLFQSILADKVRVVAYATGQTLDTAHYFYIIYQGQVRLHVVENNVITSSRILVSGEMFDLKFIGFFAPDSVFDQGEIRCQALTDTQLFAIAREDLPAMANHPFAKGVWQALLIHNLSYVVESYLSPQQRSTAAASYCDNVFAPLASWERADPYKAGSGRAWIHPLTHLMASIQQSFSPPWPWRGHPTGIRHTQLPPPPQRPPQPSSSSTTWFRRVYARRESNDSST